MDEQTHYRDGNVVLYRRPNVEVWQARLKLDKGWKRISTGAKDVESAATKACDEYDNIRFRVRNNLQPTTRKMSALAKLVSDEWQTKLDAGELGENHRNYIGIIKKWITPFFGNYNIDSVTSKLVADWYAWMTKQNKGVKFKKTTINNRNVVLTHLLEFALVQGWINQYQMPLMANDGVKGEARPAFELSEYMAIRFGLQRFSYQHRPEAKVQRFEPFTKPTNSHSAAIRVLLRYYVLFLLQTGIRPGIEMDLLQWKHVEEIKIDGQWYTRVTLPKGKTGGRQLIAKTMCSVDLAGWRKYVTTKLGREPLPDEHIWRLPTGEKPKWLSGMFEQFLTQANLLYDTAGKKRVLYSCRHSYATWQIVYRDIDYPTLAANMGTSVAMIEAHYSHLTPTKRAVQLSGRHHNAVMF